MKNILILILISYVCYSCTYNSNTKKTLELAGNNQKELLKVIEYYKNEPNKKTATFFLLSNMSYKFAYSGELLEHYDMLLHVFDSLYKQKVYTGDPAVIKQTWDFLTSQYGPLLISRLDTTYDCHILTSDFLINNIDTAFASWKRAPSYITDNFESFCEFVLPYRISNETIELYRKDYFNKYHSLVDSAKDNALDLLSRFNSEFSWNQKYKTSAKMWDYPVALPISKMELCHRGSCRQLCVYCALVMRACGLPVTIDRVNCWGNRSQGHEWNVLLLKGDSILPFDPFSKERMQFVYKPTKIFRSMFSNNHLPNNAPKEGEVPSHMINPNEKDVTEQYGPTYDITIDCIYPDYRLKQNNYSVICIFDNKDWIPVYWGTIQKNRMTFKKMMGDVCYMAAYYEDGEIFPASDPFILEKDGTIRFFKANNQKPITLKLKRKFPRFKRMEQFAYQMLTSSVRACNRSDLKKSTKLFKITKTPYDISDSIISINQKFRYVYMDIATYRTGNIAEVEFYGKKYLTEPEQKLEGRIFGLPETQTNTYAMAMDGDYNTYFSKPKNTQGYVGLDLGPNGHSYITRVRFAPRSDSNFILPNNMYELCYWDKGKWISKGKQIAKDLIITFENVPSNTCYILHNLSNGVEERIFTYENEEQIWW